MTETKRRDLTAQEAKKDIKKNQDSVVFEEMDRLRKRVDVVGWESQQGHALLNLMLTQIERLLIERSSLQERLKASHYGWVEGVESKRINCDCRLLDTMMGIG